MTKGYPIRTCIGCGKREPKHNLTRIVLQNDQRRIYIDPAGRRPGRGAYLHKEAGCIERGLSPRCITRTFRGTAAPVQGLAEAVLKATERVAM